MPKTRRVNQVPHIAVNRRRCSITGRQVHPDDGFAFGQDRTIFYSQEGYNRHLAALAALSGGPIPDGCQDCGSAWGNDRNARGESTMTVLLKDGCYQVLCRRCADRFEALEKDRYKGTPYAVKKKLI